MNSMNHSFATQTILLPWPHPALSQLMPFEGRFYRNGRPASVSFLWTELCDWAHTGDSSTETSSARDCKH